MTKKIDEAVSLNVSSQQGEMTSNTTFTADDVAALAAMLKNAGIAGNSNLFNGSATLTMDASENGASMNTTISSPDLRSIMQLLEPEFQEVSQDDEIAPEMPAEEPCVDGAADVAPEADVAVVPSDEVDMDMDLENPIEEQALTENSEDWVYEMMVDKEPGSEGCSEDNNDYGEHCVYAWTTVTPQQFAQLGEDGAADAAAASCDALAGDLDGYEPHMSQFMPNDYDVEGGIDYSLPALYFKSWLADSIEESTEMQPYAGIADRKPVQPATKPVPARSGDNPLDEEGDEQPKSFADYFREATTRNHVEPKKPVVSDDLLDEFRLNELSGELKDRYSAAAKISKQKHQDRASELDDLVWDAEKGVKSGTVRPEVKDRVARVRNGHDRTAWKREQGLDRLGQLDELSNELKNVYFKKAANDINIHANHSSKMRGIGNDDQADKHDRHIMKRAQGMNRAIHRESNEAGDRYVVASRAYPPYGFVVIDSEEPDHLKASVSDIFPTRVMAQGEAELMNGRAHPQELELDEAGRADWQQKVRQYGQPYYLNTDCGYSSLELIMQGEGFFTDMLGGLATHSSKVGFTVLEIERSGKKGYNFINSYDDLQPGTPVTCVTQTRDGQKMRPGKFITSFTARDLSTNYDQVVAELAQLGITPSKKLPVKTFD